MHERQLEKRLTTLAAPAQAAMHAQGMSTAVASQPAPPNRRRSAPALGSNSHPPAQPGSASAIPCQTLNKPPPEQPAATARHCLLHTTEAPWPHTAGRLATPGASRWRCWPPRAPPRALTPPPRPPRRPRRRRRPSLPCQSGVHGSWFQGESRAQHSAVPKQIGLGRQCKTP